MSIEDADGEQVAMFPGQGCGLPGAIRTCSSSGIPGDEPAHDNMPTTGLPLGKRLAWFVALWAAGVVTVSALAFLIRLWLL